MRTSVAIEYKQDPVKLYESSKWLIVVLACSCLTSPRSLPSHRLVIAILYPTCPALPLILQTKSSHELVEQMITHSPLASCSSCSTHWFESIVIVVVVLNIAHVILARPNITKNTCLAC